MVVWPFILIPIPILGSMASFLYATPLGLIGGILGSTKMFVHSEVFYVFPNSSGWPIVVAFWFIVGAFAGYFIFCFRRSIYSKRNLTTPRFGFLGFLLVILLQICIGYFLLYFIQPYNEKEKIQAQIEKQRYYDENCTTVYTKKSNYKILECPGDRIVAVSSAASIEYLSEKGQINKN